MDVMMNKWIDVIICNYNGTESMKRAKEYKSSKLMITSKSEISRVGSHVKYRRADDVIRSLKFWGSESGSSARISTL